jgi:hypothetical protein
VVHVTATGGDVDDSRSFAGDDHVGFSFGSRVPPSMTRWAFDAGEVGEVFFGDREADAAGFLLGG